MNDLQVQAAAASPSTPAAVTQLGVWADLLATLDRERTSSLSLLSNTPFCSIVHLCLLCQHREGSLSLTQEPRKEYDVYVNDPQPLDEGEEKHVISAFVADESGMINRVAGVFARRGQYSYPL